VSVLWLRHSTQRSACGLPAIAPPQNRGYATSPEAELQAIKSTICR